MEGCAASERVGQRLQLVAADVQLGKALESADRGRQILQLIAFEIDLDESGQLLEAVEQRGQAVI